MSSVKTSEPFFGSGERAIARERAATASYTHVQAIEPHSRSKSRESMVKRPLFPQVALPSARHASVMAGRGCRYRCTFCASFILGSPGEDEEHLKETLALAARIASDWTVLFFSTPYPGTEL